MDTAGWQISYWQSVAHGNHHFTTDTDCGQLELRLRIANTAVASELPSFLSNNGRQPHFR